METTKFAKISNNIIALGLLSLIVFAWCKKLIPNQILSIILTAMTVTIIATEIHHFSKKRTNRLNLKNSELKFQKACIWHFLESSQQANINFFKKALSNFYHFENSTTILFDKSKSTLITPQFENPELSTQNFLSCIKKAKSKKANNLIIFCASKSKEIDNLIKNVSNLKIIILNDYETFGLLKELKIYPIAEQTAPSKKQKRTHALLNKENFFSRAKVKPFLWCGIMLYISSIFAPYKTYYIIVASICLLISAICLIFTKNPKQQSNYEAVLSSKQ